MHAAYRHARKLHRREELTGGAGDDQLLSGRGNDYVDGGFGVDLAFGSYDDDVVAGGPGDDALVAGPGEDEYLGQGGDDALVVESSDTNLAPRHSPDDDLSFVTIDLTTLDVFSFPGATPAEEERLRADLIALASTPTGAELLNRLAATGTGPGSVEIHIDQTVYGGGHSAGVVTLDPEATDLRSRGIRRGQRVLVA